ncbi:MAG: hypothetical protein CVV06_06750 [Gammaproteobacteria bacterium HGW-Gammaproteobacteria-10]|nr:MAG: hypothetical protein CVV06_06750 [Gammaproteobacteria bacterium HGW-Gammaproteobacteria-10]
METAMSKILSEIDPQQLPAIPKVLLNLIEAFQNQDTGFEDLTRIISQDAGLSSKILSAANSPFYQQFGDVKDLNRVLIILGLEPLKTLTMTSVAQQFFNQISPSHQNYLEVIWFRSLACAHFARRLAKLIGFESPDQAYLTGLLHRIGQLGLLQCFPKEYGTLLNDHSEDLPESLEKKTLGISHCEIGAHIIDTWNIPGFLADAVLYQNRASSAILDSPALVKLINLAAQLSRFDNQNSAVNYAEAHALFGLGQAILDEIAIDVKKQVEQTAGSLGIAVAKPEDGTTIIRAKLEERNVIQKRLGKHAKDLAFLGAIARNNDLSEQFDKILSVLLRNLNILFGLRSTAVFLVNPEKPMLEGYPLPEQNNANLLSNLSIELKPNRSLVANALLNQRLLDSYQTTLPDPIPVIDRQICRLLGSEGIIAIPLSANNRHWGVIVAGLAPTDLLQVKAKRGLISLFAGEATRMLANQRVAGERIKENIDSMQSDFQLHVKKIIHEANNPLSIINNYLYLLSLKLGSDSPQEIGLIQEEINRVGEIILRLSETPPQESAGGDSDPIDINQTLSDLIALFEGGLFVPRRIEASLKLDDRLPKIAVSKSKLKQILTNLIKNAAEALPDGGQITISTRDRVYLGNHCYVEIQIHDDGPGLPDTISEQLFRPVTSTKGEGHSGLGLTIVKNLVDELAGTIGCNSTPDEGTTFQIFLPRTL